MAVRITSLALIALVAMMPAQKAKSGQVVASVYGEELRGSPVACTGESFDPDGFSAASKSLPCGTRLLVKHEGHGVAVTVTDRGPFVPGRDLDLSKAAGDAIGLSDEGVGAVEVSQVSQPSVTDILPDTGGPGQ